MDAETKYLIQRLAMMLDACEDALNAAAKAEARRENGKALRQITEQERAKHARKLVAEAEAFLEAAA